MPIRQYGYYQYTKCERDEQRFEYCILLQRVRTCASIHLIVKINPFQCVCFGCLSLRELCRIMFRIRAPKVPCAGELVSHMWRRHSVGAHSLDFSGSLLNTIFDCLQKSSKSVDHFWCTLPLISPLQGDSFTFTRNPWKNFLQFLGVLLTGRLRAVIPRVQALL